MMMLAVSSCGDDDDFSDNGNNNGGGKQLAKLTWVYNEGGSQTYVEEIRFTYNGGQLSHAELWDGGVRDWYADFSYNGTRLGEINLHEGNDVAQIRYTYSGNNPSSADIYYNGQIERTIQFTCNNMGQITSTSFDYGDFVMNYTWEGNNVVREDIVSEGYYTFSYDNKINPINNAFVMLALLMGEGDVYYLSANNLTYRSSTWYSGDGSSRSFSYTYTDNYPATASYSSSGGSGTYHYYYTDGTGSNYTGGGSQQNYTVSVSANNSSYGYVTGGGTYPAGSTVTLTAYPYSGYQFSHWSDGSSQNPRTITVNGNVSYTAYFTSSGGGNTSVTFGSTTWSNVYYDLMRYYSSYDAILGYLDSRSDGQIPYIYMLFDNISAGSVSLTADDNGSMPGYGLYNRLEYYENTSLFSVSGGDTTYYGDWWAKSVSAQFSSLNVNAGTVNLTISATMFDAYGAFINSEGVNGASTRSLYISVPNLTFDQAKKVMASVQNMNRRSLALRHNMNPGRLQVKR